MSRPRGFVSWRPAGKTQKKLDAVNRVLEEYADYLPMTLRQIYYRLVVEQEESDREQLLLKLG